MFHSDATTQNYQGLLVMDYDLDIVSVRESEVVELHGPLLLYVQLLESS
jgi:hypothetical protein